MADEKFTPRPTIEIYDDNFYDTESYSSETDTSNDTYTYLDIVVQMKVNDDLAKFAGKKHPREPIFDKNCFNDLGAYVSYHEKMAEHMKMEGKQMKKSKL